MKLKAIIFDVDGTLADTEKDGHRIAFNKAFSDANLDWNWDEELYGKLLAVTGGKERIKYYINNFDVNNTKNIDDSFIKELHMQKTKYYVQIMQEGKLPLRRGVKRLILEAREKNIKLAIATTTTYDNVASLLTSTLGEESIEWFETIGAGDMVANKKPANDIYLLVLDQLELSPTECIAIEDSYNGLISSTTADLKTLITVNEYTKEHDFSKASLVVESLGCENNDAKVVHGNLLNNIVNIQSLEKLL